MARERLEYIDVSKGILIICVILGHVAGICKEYGGISNNYLNHTGWLLAMFYIPFYMQAFFLITGYTSNFNKPFVLFFKQNFLRILLPYICFGILYATFNKLFFNQDFFYVTMDGEKLFFLVEYYWFLSSLFIAKILFWILNKVNNKFLVLMICLLFLYVGIMISSYYKSTTGTAHWHNYFHYRNALMMLVFMGIGFVQKNTPPNRLNAVVISGGILYLILFASFLLLGIHIPSDGHGTSLSFADVPLHLLFATTGTFFVMLVSKSLSGRVSLFLQIFGRNSLVVYVTHYLILEAVAVGFGCLCHPVGKLEGMVSYVAIACPTLIICYFSILLFQKRPFCYLLGDV